MRKMLLLFLVAVIFSVLYTACDIVDLTPAPEVDILWFDPVGQYVMAGEYQADISEIQFCVMNYVDAIIRRQETEFRSVNNGDIVATHIVEGMGIQLAGGTEW